MDNLPETLPLDLQEMQDDLDRQQLADEPHFCVLM
jgi:hypothetical protein